MPRRVALRGELVRHPYNPRYGRFMPESTVDLEIFEHAGITQSIGLDALKIQEFGDTSVIGMQKLLIDLRLDGGSLDLFKAMAPEKLRFECETKNT